MNVRLTILPVAIAFSAMLGGCATKMDVQSPQAELPAGEGSAAFLDRVATQETVSENDAIRGVLMLMDGQDTAETFQQRVDTLRQRGVVNADWSFDADRPITRGKLAYMIYQACRLPRGVWTLGGPSQRYALREAQYRGIIAPGAFYNPVQGMEYVGILNRADAWLENGSVPEFLATGRR